MTISYNEPVTFGQNGSAVGLNCEGIDFSEDGPQSWTCAPMAEMDIQLPFARQDVTIEVAATPFIVPDLLLTQNIFIFLGGLFVAYYSLAGHAIRTFPVNRNAVSGRATRLSLVIPTATSPKAMDISEDLRMLGIHLTSITFKTAP
jgi:hypothetical protein